MQEVKASVAGIRRILGHLPDTWRVVFSDVSGNSERLLCLYDSSGVQIGDEIGEATFTPRELGELREQNLALPPAVKTQLRRFDGFNRSPHLTTFQSGTSEPFALANLHLYFSDMTRRLLGGTCDRLVGIASPAPRERLRHPVLRGGRHERPVQHE